MRTPRQLHPRATRDDARSIVFCLIILFVPTACRAQNFRGSLVGAVTDSTGSRVPSANILLQASEFPVERQTASDCRGEFRFDDLLPGAYTVTVRAPGFAEATANVQGEASSVVTQPMDTTSRVLKKGTDYSALISLTQP
jgi:hypothetical protein